MYVRIYIYIYIYIYTHSHTHTHIHIPIHIQYALKGTLKREGRRACDTPTTYTYTYTYTHTHTYTHTVRSQRHPQAGGTQTLRHTHHHNQLKFPRQCPPNPKKNSAYTSQIRLRHGQQQVRLRHRLRKIRLRHRLQHHIVLWRGGEHWSRARVSASVVVW